MLDLRPINGCVYIASRLAALCSNLSRTRGWRRRGDGMGEGESGGRGEGGVGEGREDKHVMRGVIHDSKSTVSAAIRR